MLIRRVLGAGPFLGLGLLLTACAAPTPASPNPTTPPAKPTAAPAATGPTAPAGSPAAKPTVAASRAASPAASPVAKAGSVASPAPSPVAKAAAVPSFNEQAVADFYRGKVVRIMVGASPGGGFDLQSRLLANHLSRHIPGNPTVIVENKPGAGTLLVANTVYNSEAKDGTVMGSFNEALVLEQAIGAESIQFDARRYNWIGSANQDVGACMTRTDIGVSSVQDLLGGREFKMGSPGAGVGENTPKLLNAALGTNFTLIRGYNDSANVRLAIQRKEIDGYCTSLSTLLARERQEIEGTDATLKVFLVTGDKSPDHPLLAGVPAAESLARTPEARALLRAGTAPGRISKPFAVAPEVPRDRVEALRKAVADAYADPELRAESARTNLEIEPSTGEEVTRVVTELLNTPPDILERLKQTLATGS